MKKLLFVLMMLCAVMNVQAQTIQVGQKFWDGYELYTVQEIRLGNIVYMTTKHDGELTLEKIAGKQGEYKLIPAVRQKNVPSVLSSAGGCSISRKKVRTSLLSVSLMVT